MAVFENFPYTNIHEMNYDWIIKQIKILDENVDDLEKLVKDDIASSIDTYVKEYIDKNLSSFLLGAMYNASDYSLKVQQVEVLIESDHVYNNAREEVLVLEGR